MEVKNVGKRLLRTLGRAVERRQRYLEPSAQSRVPVSSGPRVLVLGVYLGDRPNTVSHLVRRFEESNGLRVEQRWAAIGTVSADPQVAAQTKLLQTSRVSKFKLLNQLLDGIDTSRFDFVVLSDDDILVRADLLTALLRAQERFGFALCQPARTWSSYNEHLLVLQRPWLSARETRFVECGPLVSLDRRAVARLLPFDPDTPLWGVDLVWPAVLGGLGLKLGIVDSVTVAHTLRAQAALYDTAQQFAEMGSWLHGRPHLQFGEAMTTVRRFAR